MFDIVTGMAITVDLIRHAESGMNVDMANADVPFIGGRQNEIDLSPLGERQAPNIGYFALSNEIRPTDFYTSPAIRTRRTHTLSSTAMGLSVDAIIDDRLQELDQGEWTNQPRTLYRYPENKREMDRLGSDFAPPGGESMNMVYRRISAFLDSLVAPVTIETEARRHIWVHTHGVVIKTYIGKLLGWTHEQTHKAPIDNASLTRLEYNGTWNVISINQSTSEQP